MTVVYVVRPTYQYQNVKKNSWRFSARILAYG